MNRSSFPSKGLRDLERVCKYWWFFHCFSCHLLESTRGCYSGEHLSCVWNCFHGSLLPWLRNVSLKLILLELLCSGLNCALSLCKWKEKVTYCVQPLEIQTEGVMAFSFVSDLFEWLHYISLCVLWCRVKVQHSRAVVSQSKVGSMYQAFHHRCILTNGNTSDTLLYLISPWWQTVNH